MGNKGAGAGDRIRLVLAAAAASGLLLALLFVLNRFSGLAYVLALLTLLAWPAVALRLVRQGGPLVAVYAYGTYILLLAYLVGHALPYRGIANGLGRAGHAALGMAALTALFGWASEASKRGPAVPDASAPSPQP